MSQHSHKFATPPITDCPEHLRATLAQAEDRWWQRGIRDHRIFQAQEVLDGASSLCAARSWFERETQLEAELGAWLVALAFREETARIEENKRATGAAKLAAELDAEEQEVARAAVAAHRANKGKR